MIAETAFNVIQELSSEELRKLYTRLKVSSIDNKPIKKSPKSQTGYTLEFALNHLKQHEFSEKTKLERIKRKIVNENKNI